VRPLDGFQVSGLGNFASYLLILEIWEKEYKFREVWEEVMSSLLDILGMKCQ